MKLQADITKYQLKEKELENINQMLKDEHQALQLAFASLEDKLRKAQVNFVQFFHLCENIGAVMKLHLLWIHFLR